MKSVCAIIISLAFIGSTQAVANGTVELQNASPWQAKLYFSSGLFTFWPCGGTLISQNFVLTAARCLKFQKSNVAEDVYVHLSAWDLQNTTEGTVSIRGITVNNIIVHEDYNADTYENDIALVKLPYAVNYTVGIQPANLATQRNVQIGDVARISGWQYPIREYDLYHQYPHGGDVSVVENSLCQETYPDYVIDEDTICASGTVAFCYGDEGIALPVNGEIVGMAYGAKAVLTPSEECPIIPQTYLSIAKYLDWIKANSDYEDN